MSIVILAEKPSQAQAYASAFKQSDKKKGYFVVTDPLFSDETFITFGFGHLVELVPPGAYDEKWEKWRLDTLPIFPHQFKFQVASDKKEQFNVVKKLLNEATTIIIATDSDREGENIAWSIIEKAGAYSESKQYKRLWINSLEKEAIRDGFQHLKNGLDFLPQYKEAQTRQMSDWLIGMNGSPLYSLLLQKKGIQGAFSLGRVQTPTLYMIYSRQVEISSFKKTPYYEFEGIVQSDKGKFKGYPNPRQRYETKEEAITRLSSLDLIVGQQEGQIANVTTQDKKISSPLLFSLSSLQSQVNKQFKASASETLKAVQSLYEAKLLTYPRTDTQVITVNEFEYLKTHLDSYKQFLGITIQETQTEPRKRYVNGSKVQEHHAIIPTKRVATNQEFEKLSPLQKNIYTLVMKTTVAMFLADSTYQETIIETAVKQFLFQSKGKTPVDNGWQILFPKKEEESLLPKVSKGDHVTVAIDISEKETTPPKPFTEGTLITAMKTAGKTLDDEEAQKILSEVEGIGTEATRANIIETLKNKKYVEVQKNNLVVTEKGKILCQAVASERLLSSAEMTAEWESYLKRIGRQEGSQEQFLTNIKKFIVHLIEGVPSAIETIDFGNYQKAISEEKAKDSLGNCPNCGQLVLPKKGFYGCSNYPTCTFSMNTIFRGKKLTKTNIKQLLSTNKTIVKGIKKKESDKTYDAVITVDKKGFYQFKEFAKSKKKKP